MDGHFCDNAEGSLCAGEQLCCVESSGRLARLMSCLDHLPGGKEHLLGAAGGKAGRGKGVAALTGWKSFRLDSMRVRMAQTTTALDIAHMCEMRGEHLAKVVG